MLDEASDDDEAKAIYAQRKARRLENNVVRSHKTLIFNIDDVSQKDVATNEGPEKIGMVRVNDF